MAFSRMLRALLFNAGDDRLDLTPQLPPSQQTLQVEEADPLPNTELPTPSPISSLPPELLAHIFLHTTPNVISTHSRLWIPGLVFGSVCWKWRNTAKFSPQIWANIKIEASYSPSQTPRLRMALRKVLKQSADCLLTIDMDLDSENYDSLESDGPTAPHQLLALLVEHSHRWYALKLDIEFGVLINNLRPVQGFPLLQHLDLKLAHAPFTTAAIHDAFYTSAPEVRSLTLRWKRDMDVFLPWSGLHDLTYYGVECLDDLTFALNSSPHLQSLTVVDVFNFCTCFTHSTATSNITSLTISVETEDALSKVILKLTLPQLTTLSLFARKRKSHKRSSFPPQATICDKLGLEIFSQFLTRSQCTIRTLSLEAVSINLTDLHPFLHCFPDVHALHIIDGYPDILPTSFMCALLLNLEPDYSGRGSSDESTLQFYHTSTSEAPLPHLVHVDMVAQLGPANSNFDGKIIVDMIGSRRRVNLKDGAGNHARLQSVRLRLMGESRPTPAVLKRLKYLQQGGLDVFYVEP